MNNLPANPEDYVNTLSLPDPVFDLSVQAIDQHGLPNISVNAADGRMLQFLLHSINARTVLEIGTLAGYSAIKMAQALPADGKLTTLEVDDRHADIAEGLIEQVGLSDRIQVLRGPALDTLQQLDDIVYDAVFIDADKRSYEAYLAWAFDHVRTGGLVMYHNAFADGNLFDAGQQGSSFVQQITAANTQVFGQQGFFAMIIPIGDGLGAALKVDAT